MRVVKIWTDEEIAFLHANYQQHGCKYCSEYLGRSTFAVNNRALRLGLQTKRLSDGYREDMLREKVAQSRNMSDLCAKLGINHAGSSYTYALRYIKNYGIDTSHFEHKVRSPKLLEERLTENSTLSRGSVKKYLYKHGIKERLCEMCGQGEEWYGKKISLILDHINGVYNDNRVENIRIVCPNCNATLDTHCGKLTPEVVAERKAKKEKAKRVNLERAGIEKRKVKERPAREDLQKMVDEQGYSAVGRSYGVSDNAIRKWLK